MFRAGLAARWLGLPRVPVCVERKRDYSTHHASHPEAEDAFMNFSQGCVKFVNSSHCFEPRLVVRQARRGRVEERRAD